MIQPMFNAIVLQQHAQSQAIISSPSEGTSRRFRVQTRSDMGKTTTRTGRRTTETPTAMVDVFENMAAVFNAPTITTQDEQGQTVTVQQNITKEEKREHFQSIVEYIKDESKLCRQKNQFQKRSWCFPTLPRIARRRESVELAKPESTSKACRSVACEEADIDLAAQVAAYDVSLEAVTPHAF